MPAPKMSAMNLIGNTPMLHLGQFDTGLCELYLKLESQNPGGSIKDRMALPMVEDAERQGLIKPGDTLVEASAGNTGLALAQVATMKGYKLIVVVPDKVSQEKINHLRAMAAHVVVTRNDVQKGHPDYYHEKARAIAEMTPNAYYINQFENLANPAAHEATTAPEIWEQMEHRVDAIVCGVGTGGTMAGLARFFKKVSPSTDMILADPVGSVLASYVTAGKLEKAGSWLVEGIGEDFIPPHFVASDITKAYSISDEDSIRMARGLLMKTGILGGPSSGTLIAAALKYCRYQKTPKRVVTFVCDSGSKYLSKIYNPEWLRQQGFKESEQQ
jgi:cystathionine beta-synthase